MPELNFEVMDAEPIPFSVAPQLMFKLRVTNSVLEEPIQSIALRCQIRIEATRRPYSSQEKEQLFELFGKPDLWSRSVRSMLWTYVSVAAPPFSGSITLDLPVPCTYDFNIASAKYFYALGGGEVPLSFLFSGTVFYMGDGEALQVTQIPWDKEATFHLPVRVWREMMNLYYPNSAWLCLRKDVFDHLYHYKVSRGFPTWEQTVESLLAETELIGSFTDEIVENSGRNRPRSKDEDLKS